MQNTLEKQRGQAGLIVLLVMVVVTTVAVSVSTRSVSELRISRQEQESTRTLNLAESGIEEILKQDVSTLGSSGTVSVAGNSVPYTITAENTISNYALAKGHTLEVDIAGATQLQFQDWGCANLSITLIRDGNNLSREVVKKGTCTGVGANVSVPYSKTFTNNHVMARIKALYEPATITVNRVGGTNALYYRVETVAALDDGSTRAVSVNRFPGSLPSIFDYVLFSGSDLVKN